MIAALAVARGDVDAMICGLEGRFGRHLEHIRNIIGLRPDVHDFSTVNLAILTRGLYFFADTYVSADPTASELVEIARLTAQLIRRFGIEPKIAFLSQSSFGSADTFSARKMREAVATLHAQEPELEVDGEMHGNAALDAELRRRVLPDGRLKDEANAFILPNLDAANIAYQLVMGLGEATPVGPILLGAARPCHILTPSVTARGVINMTAIAAVEAQDRQAK